MSKVKKIQKQAKRRCQRTRAKQSERGKLFRVSVFRSARQIYAQVIDDVNARTVCEFSSMRLSEKVENKKAAAFKVGVQLAELAKEQKVSAVFFDRGQYIYHGRVAALADGLREGGLTL